MYAPERNSPGRAKESSLWADVGVALGSFGLLYDVTMRVRKRPPRVKSARCVSVSDVPRVDLDEFCVSWIPFNAAGGAVVRGGGGHVGDDLAVLHGGLCGEESRVASLSAVDMWIKANATVLKRVGYDFCLEHVKIYARLMHECVVSSGACVIGKGVITCSVFIPRRRFDAAWVRIIDFLEDHATRGEFPINVAVLAQLVTGSPCHFAANRASGTGILVTFVTSVCTKGLKEAMKELIVQVVRDHEARLLPEPSVGELGLVDIWRLQRGFSRHVQDFEDVRTRVLNVGYGKALCAEFKHFWIDEDSRIQEDRLSPVSSASGTEFPSIAHTKAEGETYTGQEVYETAVVQDWSDLSSDEYEVVEEELFMATRLSTARADRFKRKLAAVSTERWVDVATGEIRCMWMYICVYVIIWFAFFGNEVRQSIRR